MGTIVLNQEVFETALNQLVDVDGVLAALFISMSDGHVIAERSNRSPEMNLNHAAQAYAQILRAQYKVIKILKQQDQVKDIQITQDQQYHLIMSAVGDPDVFLLVIVSREKGNPLAMVRLAMNQLQKSMVSDA